jgi:S1-C subfamily serine protease
MKSITRFDKLMGALIIGGSATGLVLGAGALQEHQAANQSRATHQEVARAEGLADLFRDIGKRVEPSVVEIQVRRAVKTAAAAPQIPDEFRKFFPNFNFPQMPSPGEGGNMEQIGTGSGVIMQVDGNTGYILTNNHVAGGAS